MFSKVTNEHNVLCVAETRHHCSVYWKVIQWEFCVSELFKFLYCFPTISISFFLFVVHIGQLEGTVVQKTSKIKELEDEIRKLKDRLSWLESERKSLENQKESLSESQQSQLKSLERVGHGVKGWKW